MAAGANDPDIKMARANFRTELTQNLRNVQRQGQDLQNDGSQQITPIGVGGFRVVHAPHSETVDDRSVQQSRISHNTVDFRWGDLNIVLKGVDIQRIFWETPQCGTLVET